MFRPIDTQLAIPPFAEVRDPRPPDARALAPASLPRAAVRELPWPRAVLLAAMLFPWFGLLVALVSWLR